MLMLMLFALYLFCCLFGRIKDEYALAHMVFFSSALYNTTMGYNKNKFKNLSSL